MGSVMTNTGQPMKMSLDVKKTHQNVFKYQDKDEGKDWAKEMKGTKLDRTNRPLYIKNNKLKV